MHELNGSHGHITFCTVNASQPSPKRAQNVMEQFSVECAQVSQRKMVHFMFYNSKARAVRSSLDKTCFCLDSGAQVPMCMHMAMFGQATKLLELSSELQSLCGARPTNMTCDNLGSTSTTRPDKWCIWFDVDHYQETRCLYGRPRPQEYANRFDISNMLIPQ